MYCIICPFWKTFDEVWVTYFVPDFLTGEIKIWQIVEIPLKTSIENWIVIKITKNLKIDFDKSKIKSIISIKNKNIFLTEYQKELLPWIAKYYFTPIHNWLNLLLPKNLKTKINNKKLIFESKKDYIYNYDQNLKLSEKQEEAFKKIIKSDYNKNLLYWLTWSWKTEIYIKLIKENLDNNKQSLLLIPEIILTNQISSKIKKIFWKDILIINSTVTDALKTKYWMDIYFNKSKIIIWTRSALFYPYNNLGLIIIDEEHDNSYISDQAPRYNSIKIAEKITEINWNTLLIWSWTPSTNSMYKAIKKEYNLITLLEKFDKSLI